jgi:transglutaminase-like putative cysteine protease
MVNATPPSPLILSSQSQSQTQTVAPAGIRYHVEHQTHYRYSAPVSVSRHVLHLSPRACDWQTVHAASLDISPLPARVVQGEDPFGNPETRIACVASHRELHVASRLDVSVLPRPWAAGTAASPAWEEVQGMLRLEGSAPLDPRRYRFESPHVRVKNDLAGFAQESFPPGVPLLEAVADLVARIHRDFRYDPGATSVGTSVLEVLARRRGVCQDFAHLAIACLRSLGLAARYVSGYLCTEPPPGMPRLIGVDATHAWFSLWCPGVGWVEFDPTNNCLADRRYLVLAWGRDFGDVSPMRGVIQGGADHVLDVQVTVLPVTG